MVAENKVLNGFAYILNQEVGKRPISYNSDGGNQLFRNEDDAVQGALWKYMQSYGDELQKKDFLDLEGLCDGNEGYSGNNSIFEAARKIADGTSSDNKLYTATIYVFKSINIDWQQTDSYYQDLILVDKTKVVDNVSIDLNLKKVSMSGVKNLAGAKINISKSTNIKRMSKQGEFISAADGNFGTITITPSRIQDEGYVQIKIKEIESPKGYKLSSETINFTLEADGTIKSVVMYNEREVTKVKISKQDIANGNKLLQRRD